MTMSTFVHTAWLHYEQDMIPREAPRIQHEECRRVFYAGVAALLGALMDIGGSTISEEDGAEAIENIQQEVIEFRKSVINDCPVNEAACLSPSVGQA
jgi:hypothetical protein